MTAPILTDEERRECSLLAERGRALLEEAFGGPLPLDTAIDRDKLFQALLDLVPGPPDDSPPPTS